MTDNFKNIVQIAYQLQKEITRLVHQIESEIESQNIDTNNHNCLTLIGDEFNEYRDMNTKSNIDLLPSFQDHRLSNDIRDWMSAFNTNNLIQKTIKKDLK